MRVTPGASMVGLNFQLRQVSFFGPVCHRFASEPNLSGGRGGSQASATKAPSSRDRSIIVHRLYSCVPILSVTIPTRAMSQDRGALAITSGVPAQSQLVGADNAYTPNHFTIGPF